MATPGEQKKVKLRFITIYAASLVLIFVVVTAFWKKRPGEIHTSLPADQTGEFFMQFDTALHARLDELDNVYASYLQNLDSGKADATDFFPAKLALQNALDSIAKEASFLTNGSKKETMDAIVRRYRSSLAIRNRLINELNYLPQNKALTRVEMQNRGDAQARAEIDRLNILLAERDKQILLLQQSATTVGNNGTDAQLRKDLAEKSNLVAALQAQLKQKDAALQKAASTNDPGGSGAEWRQKFLSLKAAYDKVVESEKSLRSAYKTIADDNKRLLSQLQGTKKG